MKTIPKPRPLHGQNNRQVTLPGSLVRKVTHAPTCSPKNQMPRNVCRTPRTAAERPVEVSI